MSPVLIARSEYLQVRIDVFHDADGFSVALSDTEPKIRINHSERFSTEHEAKLFAKALAFDYMHQHRGKPQTTPFEKIQLRWDP
jgi:hypothetical protein